jgi:hypothetical protein
MLVLYSQCTGAGVKACSSITLIFCVVPSKRRERNTPLKFQQLFVTSSIVISTQLNTALCGACRIGRTRRFTFGAAYFHSIGPATLQCQAYSENARDGVDAGRISTLIADNIAAVAGYAFG